MQSQTDPLTLYMLFNTITLSSYVNLRTDAYLVHSTLGMVQKNWFCSDSTSIYNFALHAFIYKVSLKLTVRIQTASLATGRFLCFIFISEQEFFYQYIVCWILCLSWSLNITVLFIVSFNSWTWLLIFEWLVMVMVTFGIDSRPWMLC